MAAHIERARGSDRDGVLRLLNQSHLPLEGLAEHLATTLVVRDADTIVGSAALEIYPDGALLRRLRSSPSRNSASNESPERTCQIAFEYRSNSRLLAPRVRP
jgi:hypothetical protein